MGRNETENQRTCHRLKVDASFKKDHYFPRSLTHPPENDGWKIFLGGGRSVFKGQLLNFRSVISILGELKKATAIGIFNSFMH